MFENQNLLLYSVKFTGTLIGSFPSFFDFALVNVVSRAPLGPYQTSMLTSVPKIHQNSSKLP